MKQEMYDLFKVIDNVAFYALAAFIIITAVVKKKSGKKPDKKSDKKSDEKE